MSEKDSFRVVAILSAFNEGDIIFPVISHLVENGVEVYFLDNDSTDDTVDQVSAWLGRGVIEIEKFPPDPPSGENLGSFDWGAILRRKEELANEIEADWFIHHDADEIRESPWPGVSLRDAIRWVDRLGYNCIDFRVVNFPPIDDGFGKGMDPRTYFRYWEEPKEFDSVQIKAWKRGAAAISLAPFGGHEIRFRDRRVFPIRFLLRHYPIRSQEHGERKVFAERKRRFLERERAKGWHVQYDSWKEGDSFLGEPYHLHLFDDDRVRLDLLLENEVAREAQGRAESLGGLVELREKDLESHRGSRRDLEQRVAALEELRARLESEASARERANGEIARRLGVEQGRAAALEGQLGRLSDATALANSLNSRLEAARALSGELAAARDASDGESARLARENERLRGEIREILGSTSWRWTAPLRRFLDAVKRLVAPSADRLPENSARSSR
ncbi:MAG: glycosyltransferase family 2 protein [Acidobacteriota bacterium]|nr:glycosyltransferase family 2 protein [Acidobacteriota bacterium]